jgi:hypothetical protein
MKQAGESVGGDSIHFLAPPSPSRQSRRENASYRPTLPRAGAGPPIIFRESDADPPTPVV